MSKFKELFMQHIFTVIMILIYGVGIVFLFYRVRYGVDTTDETMYVAMAYAVLRGNIPLVGLWEAQQSGSILAVPLLYMYELIMGDLTGTVLFLRYCYVFFLILCSVSVYFILKKHISQMNCILFVGVPLFAIPFAVPMFSYNTVVLGLFYVTSALFLALTMEKDEIRVRKKAIALGCMMAVLAYTYQTLIFLAIVYAICIGIYWWKEKRKMRTVLLYYCGAGAIVALLVCIILFCLCNVEGISFLENIRFGALGNPHSEVRNLAIERDYPGKNFLEVAVLNRLKNVFFSKAGVALALWTVVAVVLKKIKRFEFLTFIGMLLYIITFILGRNYGSFRNGYLALYVSVLLFVLALYLKKENRKRVILCLFIPAICTWVIRVATSLNNNCMGQVDVLVVTLLVLPLLYQDNIPDDGELKRTAQMMWGCVLSGVLVLSLCLNFYCVVYRDSAISELTTQVEGNIYGGIYTTEEKSEFVEGIDKWIKQYDDTGKMLLVLDHFPSLYVMTDAVPYTATTWSHTYHYYQVMPVDLSWMEKYYEIHGNVLPEVIYTVEYEGGDYESEHEAYKKFLEDYTQIADYQTTYSEKEYKFTRYEMQK